MMPKSRSTTPESSAPSVPATSNSQQTSNSATMTKGLKSGAAIAALGYKWRSVIARTVISCYMAVMAWRMLLTCAPRISFFKYLTNCGWICEMLYFMLSLRYDIEARLSQGNGNDESRTPETKLSERTGLQVERILMEMSFALQVVITLFFWLVVFPAFEDERSIMWDAQFHGVGLLIIVLDYMYRYMRFSLRSHRWLLGFSAFYAAIHISTVFAFGKEIYPGMHFKDMRSFVLFFSGFVTMALFHKVFYLISNWARIKAEVKTFCGVAHIILVRQSSTASLIFSSSHYGDSEGGEGREGEGDMADILAEEMDTLDYLPTRPKPLSSSPQ